MDWDLPVNPSNYNDKLLLCDVTTPLVCEKQMRGIKCQDLFGQLKMSATYKLESKDTNTYQLQLYGSLHTVIW